MGVECAREHTEWHGAHGAHEAPAARGGRRTEGGKGEEKGLGETRGADRWWTRLLLSFTIN